MPLQDLNDPHVVNFFLECYNKTARIRVKWNTENGEKLRKFASYTKEPKFYKEADIIEKTLSIGMINTKRDYIASCRNRRLKRRTDGEPFRVRDMKKGNSLSDLGLGDPTTDPRLARPDTDVTPDPIMRPVDPAVKKIIYKDKPEYGNKVYLKTRSKEPKHTHYYLPEVSQWEYGWAQSESFFKPRVPTHPRVCVLTEAVVNTGPHSDPPYYQRMQADGPRKCENMKS